MIPHERSLVQKLAGQPFVLIGVNSDKERAATQEHMAAEQMTWRSFFDGGGTSGPIATAWNVSSWPTTYVIDADGIIRHKNLRDEEAARAIEALLEKMAAGKPPKR